MKLLTKIKSLSKYQLIIALVLLQNSQTDCSAYLVCFPVALAGKKKKKKKKKQEKEDNEIDTHAMN